jgi:hypothetical protein
MVDRCRLGRRRRQLGGGLFGIHKGCVSRHEVGRGGIRGLSQALTIAIQSQVAATPGQTGELQAGALMTSLSLMFPLQSAVYPPGRFGHIVLCGGHRHPPDHLPEQGTQSGRFYVDRPALLCWLYCFGVGFKAPLNVMLPVDIADHAVLDDSFVNSLIFLNQSGAYETWVLVAVFMSIGLLVGGVVSRT